MYSILIDIQGIMINSWKFNHVTSCCNNCKVRNSISQDSPANFWKFIKQFDRFYAERFTNNSILLAHAWGNYKIVFIWIYCSTKTKISCVCVLVGECRLKYWRIFWFLGASALKLISISTLPVRLHVDTHLADSLLGLKPSKLFCCKTIRCVNPHPEVFFDVVMFEVSVTINWKI